MLSSTSKYALKSIKYIRSQKSDAYYSIDVLSDATDVPREYLAKIVKRLVKAKILESKKGPCGGIKIHQDAQGKSLYDICLILEDPITKEKCLVGSTECGVHGFCHFHETWRPLRERITKFLTNTKIT